MLEYENKYLNDNMKLIAGMDEAGRGPLAGPVSVACVIMPLGENDIINGVNDSKKLSPKKREFLYDKIVEKAIDYNITFVDEKEIDSINILNATKKAMLSCVNNLKSTPDIVLVDYVHNLSLPCKHIEIVKGDALSYSIACASILAKVARDRYMISIDNKYPLYDFKTNKGYGTKKHIEALKKYGKCDLHRNTFLKNILEK